MVLIDPFSFLQEKTKKILDIWVKANTFPAQILSSLTKTVKDSEKGAYHYPAMYSLSTFPTYTTPSFFALLGSSCKLKVRKLKRDGLFLIEPEKSLVTSDPRSATIQSKSVTPPATQSPPVQTVDPQSTLLALLLQQAAKPALNGRVLFIFSSGQG